MHKIKKYIKKHGWKNILLAILSLGILFIGIIIVWVSLLKLPDFKSFTEGKIKSSTKIYDRTGKILLYDVNQNIKRTVIPFEDMGDNIKKATIAIEDSEFYTHKGIRISSIIRATIWAKLTGRKIQGGSTITQQLIKNTLLTKERTLTRKIKEWILAVKIEKVMDKDTILGLYLNQAPYGGNKYGIQEASMAFFGVEPRDLTLAQSAYLAAIPNGPTYYSPYKKNKDKLDERKNLVLKRMLDLKFITNAQYLESINEKVVFLPEQPTHISAPHFVFFVKDYLEKTYGTDVVENGGLKVITTLDYDIQKVAEESALKHAKESEALSPTNKGISAAVVVIDPKTGQILSMVGSRDYFDKEIDGNFNVTTAQRQPGSSFKPIVYALAFKEGYTDKTTLLDVKTEFNSSCSPLGKPLPSSPSAKCYMPDNYDNKFRGPLTLREALGQSINIVAVKLLYLVGVQDAIKFAHDLGITTLNDPDRYGLSLVIGGGETTLLDMTSVYSVFGNNGVRNPYNSILSITDSDGVELEKYVDKSYKVVDDSVTRMLASVMSDSNNFISSSLNIPGYKVAVKTGTTNNNKDAWTIGFTPTIAVGAWVGKNDNTPMTKGSVLAIPIWSDVTKAALAKYPSSGFEDPDPISPDTKPILRGFWQGGETFKVDTISNTLATLFTPNNTVQEKSVTNVHTILYWINKNDPTGPMPTNPYADPLYENWEYGVQVWWNANKEKYGLITEADKPTTLDTIHTENSNPVFEILGVDKQTFKNNQKVVVNINNTNQKQIKKIDVFLNDMYIGSTKQYPYTISFTPDEFEFIKYNNVLKVVGYDTSGGSGTTVANFVVLTN